MESCVERNRLPFEGCHRFAKGQLSQALTRQEEILHDRASRYEQSLNTNKANHLDSQIKDNIERIFFNLFPEGPSGKDAKGLRFGKNGSLYIVVVKKRLFILTMKTGGGSILKLIITKMKQKIGW